MTRVSTGAAGQKRPIDGDGPMPPLFTGGRFSFGRHLTASQRAMVAGRARGIYDEQAKERQKEAGEKYHTGSKKVPVKVPEPSKGDARDLAGKAAGVSGTYVDRATRVIERAVPEVNKALDESTHIRDF